MFRHNRKELQRCCATKPIQTTKEMFEALGFNNLVEPGVKVEMYTAFHEVFERYARIVNPKGGDKKVFAFDARRLIESMCRTWAELYDIVATSREEVLKDKALLEQEVQKLSDSEDGQVKKLAGELDVCRQQLRAVQDLFMERGITIANLEQQLAVFSLKPSHVNKPHIAPMDNAIQPRTVGSQIMASTTRAAVVE